MQEQSQTETGDLIANVNAKISQLNELGYPVIFAIGGTNSSGKSTVAKYLISNCSFFQCINLGIISKLIRFFRPSIRSSKVENFDSEGNKLFVELINFFVDHYHDVGVNTVFEGVQIMPRYLTRNPNILGGVVLKVSDQTAIRRGHYPNTHFKRKITESDMPVVDYYSDSKYAVISNEDRIELTVYSVLRQLDKLLSAKLSEYE